MSSGSRMSARSMAWSLPRIWQLTATSRLGAARLVGARGLSDELAGVALGQVVGVVQRAVLPRSRVDIGGQGPQRAHGAVFALAVLERVELVAPTGVLPRDQVDLVVSQTSPLDRLHEHLG